jgi:hypothetical protein
MRRPRTTWLHVLVVVALGMTLAFAAFGSTWLPIAFPAAGILFAGGGAASAVALDRAGSARAFLLREGLRLLLPFWLFAGVLVPVMRDRGWDADENLGSAPLTWDTGWLWVLPLADPPVSTEGLAWAPGLWFVRTFLWLVLLSPALVWLFRRWPVRLCLVAVGTLVLMTAGLVNVDARADGQAAALCVWSCCWLLGVAWSDGTLVRAPLLPTLAGGAALTGAGVWWALDLQQRPNGDLYDSGLAALLFRAGAVLVLLRAGSTVAGGDRLRRTRAALAFLPRRMITVFLWTPLAVVLTPLVLARTPLAPLDVPGPQGALLEYVTAVVLLVLMAALPGTLEAWPSRWFRRRRGYVLRDNVVAEDAARERAR